jgi:thioredoxin-related protein
MNCSIILFHLFPFLWKMKKIIVFLFSIFLFQSSYSQSDPILPLYKRFPTIPPLKLLLTDSSTVFTDKNLKKNLPLLIMIFSPDCDHCQHHAEEMVINREKFKKIQVVMASMYTISILKEFYTTYQLDKLENITVGQDREFILGTYYKMKSLPFLAFYDKKGNLIDVFEGALPIDKILEKFQK